jgi:hypothetical protein
MIAGHPMPIMQFMSNYSIHITDLMTRANTVSRFEERVASLDDLKVICRSIRDEAGEAVYVEARRRRRAGTSQVVTWAIA